MTKISEVIAIIVVAVLLVSIALALSFSGVKNSKYDYIKIEINPKIEFVTNQHGKIVTLHAINDEASQLIINEEFIGLKAEEGVAKFVDLCTQANYIDVERKDNAVKLTIVSGMLHDLNVNVYREVKSYFKNNKIKSVIIENANDIAYYKYAKSKGVCSSKLALMQSVCNLNTNLTYEEAKRLTEKQMLKQIKNAHEERYSSNAQYSQEELNGKVKLINANRAKIVHHKAKISNESRREFVEEYEKFVQKNLKKYEINFNERYTKWKANKSNYAIA